MVEEPPVTSQIIQSGQGTDSVACLRASVATYRCTAAEREVNMPLQRRKEPPVTSQTTYLGQSKSGQSTASVAEKATCDLTDYLPGSSF